ncbi:MAG: capsular polysaccharide export protein, LipB/KpsS family, partial [Gemmatimonadaceae bacterium]
MAQLYEKGREIDQSKGTLLFWVPGGMPLLLHVEMAIAAAMRLRGYNVHAIICNSPYRACAIRVENEGVPIARWRDRCPGCIGKTSGFLDTIGVPYSFNGDFVSEADRAALWDQTEGITWDTLHTLSYGGVQLGNNIRSSVIRYLQGAALTGHEAVIREFAHSALISACAASNAIDRFDPWRVFMSHGIYVDWGPALHIARRREIPVTAWKSSYLTSHFYLRHVEDPSRIDFKALSEETWMEVRDNELTPRQNARLDRFFDDRYKKNISFDMRNRPKQFKSDLGELRAKYAPTHKPVWVVLSHINWDSVADFAPMAYPTFDDWILDTVRQAIDVPDVQWLVKIHPVEAWDNPATGVQRLIERNFPELPDHVRVIPAEDDVSPANLFELMDGGVTVYGTAGLELAIMGKPVIVAGEAHYGGMGFTHDALTPEVYRDLLKRAGSLGPLTDHQQGLVRKYAYSHFIQRQVPIDALHDPSAQWWGFQHQKRDSLLPGNDPFVQFICDRLVDGSDFNMTEELVAASGREVSGG